MPNYSECDATAWRTFRESQQWQKQSLPKCELAVRPITPTRSYLKPQCDAFLTFLFSTGFNCSLTNHLSICASCLWLELFAICVLFQSSSVVNWESETGMKICSLSTCCLRWVSKGFTLWPCLASSIFLLYFFPANFPPLPGCLWRVVVNGI